MITLLVIVAIVVLGIIVIYMSQPEDCRYGDSQVDECNDLEEIVQNADAASVAAASPNPPQFEAINLDMLPHKYWQPTYVGCAPAFSDQICPYYYPTPRLWKTDLNALMYERSRQNAFENMVEPIEARQSMTQFLSLGFRSRKDVYTQPSKANDPVVGNICASLARETPQYVNF